MEITVISESFPVIYNHASINDILDSIITNISNDHLKFRYSVSHIS